jgi:hypothetical protein
MLGLSDDLTEPSEGLALPPVSKVELTPQSFASYVATRGRPSETIMVIGDSFTMTHFAPMLLNHVGQVIWQLYRLMVLT